VQSESIVIGDQIDRNTQMTKPGHNFIRLRKILGPC
jgi:hypothetical protein